jgi:geranylgeranyl transferase type-1 subunit beta
MVAGSTYCGIAVLTMLNAVPHDLDDTMRWLVNRQVGDEKPPKDSEKGGFNGRVNKPPDTCYSFWVGGTLHVSPFVHHLI